MFIARRDYDAQRDELADLRARATALADTVTTLKTQAAFFIAQINQLQKERAILLRSLTKLDLPIPELVAPAAAPIDAETITRAMDASMFEDMGDVEAKRAGLTWNERGQVVDAITKQPVHA